MSPITRLPPNGPGWFSALGLDAAAIGLVWAVALWPQSWTAPATERWLLFALAIALAYAADRWIDTRRAHDSDALPPRYGPHRRYPRAIASGWLIVLGLALALAANTLSPTEWTGCLILAALAVAYPFLPERAVLPVKPLLVGVLFAGGIAILAPGPAVFPPTPAVWAFGFVCAANAVCVARLDARHAPPAATASRESDRSWIGCFAGLGAGIAGAAWFSTEATAEGLRSLGLLVTALSLLWLGWRPRGWRSGPDRWLGAMGALVAAGVLLTTHGR
ncbi:MAG: hypothetical protein ACFE0O_09020 [Opitutales bacterium]